MLIKGRWSASYNERLFSGGVRGFIHSARFEWLSKQAQRFAPAAKSVIELGCYDGRAIGYLPRRPQVYRGFDANYENAIELATDKWHGSPYTFTYCTNASQMTLSSAETFDIAIALETLEHVPPQSVEPYLEKIAAHLRGYFFVTVPNEKGPVFLAKWLGKRLLTRDDDPYSTADVFNHTFNRLRLVARDEHKGFDYAVLIKQIERYFDVLDVSAVPFSALPPWLSYGAGIIARSK